ACGVYFSGERASKKCSRKTHANRTGACGEEVTQPLEPPKPKNVLWIYLEVWVNTGRGDWRISARLSFFKTPDYLGHLRFERCLLFKEGVCKNAQRHHQRRTSPDSRGSIDP